MSIRKDYKLLESESRRLFGFEDMPNWAASAEFRQTLVCTCVTGNFNWRSPDHERLYHYFEGYV